MHYLIIIPEPIPVGTNLQGQAIVLDFHTFITDVLSKTGGNLEVMRLVVSIQTSLSISPASVILTEPERDLLVAALSAPKASFAAAYAPAIVAMADAILHAVAAPVVTNAGTGTAVQDAPKTTFEDPDNRVDPED